jgi:hypothetical protein
MIIDQPVVSGSLNVSGSSNLLGNVAITGSLTVSEGITISGSILSASFATTASNAPLYLLTSSFENYTSSINTVIKSKLNTEGVVSGSIQVQITGTTGYSTFSSSISSSIGELSSSVATTTNDLSSSFSSSLGSLSSSISSSNSTQDSRLNSLEGVTGSYATTGSNLFKGSQTISGSIIPAVDNTYDLGSITNQFRDLYLSSASLYIDGTKVLSSNTQELQITTDNGQSIKILEAGSDNITLQSFDGNIELKSSGDGDVVLDPTNGKIVLKGTTEVFSGNKIQSSVNGTPVVFASDVIVSGGITTTGQIIAQSINVQQVTSSIVFSSGSNQFGNDLLNIQTLTGSVNITGSLKLNDSNVILTNQTGSMSVATSSLALTASYVETAQTASYILQAVSSSYATTASFALNVPVTASFANEALSSSFASTASFALNVPVTASFANEALSSSFATNALTASFLLNAPETASYANEALSSSYALTASFSLNVPVTASYANEALTSSYATTASFSLSGTGFPFSGSAEITGSLLVSDLSGTGVRYVVADEDGNLNTQTPGAVIKSTQQYTATQGQTTFTVTNGYTTGLVDVFINGTKLSSDEFVDTSGTSVVITGGVEVNNVVEIVKYLPSAGVSNNALRQLTTFNVTSSQSTFNVNYTPGLLDVYYNGARLSSADYEASNGTSILFATASVSGDTVDVMVYSYQVGAFSGIGGGGTSTELSYFNTQNSITSSQNLKFDGSNLVITGSIIATQGISGPLSGTSSFAQNSNLLDGLDSVAFVQTGSFQSYTSSFSSSVATTTLNLSSSLSSSIGSLSSSVATTTSELSSSVATTTLNLSSSVATTTLNLSSSVSSSIGSLSGSIATTTSGLGGRITTIEGNYATTGSNVFVGSQVITGSLYITTDLIVQGSSSLQNITASAVSIGTNTVILNTDTPAVRFAGISVQDSGSNAGVTGSIFWDGLCNRWIYSNPSDIGYSGGMFLSGPRSSTLGSESPLTCNYVAKSGGGDHLYDSCIIDDGTTTCIKNNLIGTGTACFASSVDAGSYIRNTNSGADAAVTIAADGVSHYISATNANRTAYRNLLLNPYSCNVGIGTSSPFSLLHVGTRPGAGTTNPSLSSMLTVSNDGLTGIDLGGNVNANNVVGHINWVNYLGVGNYNTARIDVYANGAGNSGDLRFWTATIASSPTIRLTISSTGAACFSCELTAKTIGTNDLILNNLNYECANYVDGTRGSWLIQEGENDLFIINQISCKKYKFNLIEIK